jgi:hypothetical protein
MALYIAPFLVLAIAQGSRAAPPPEDMVKKLTETVRKHCPEATIEVTKEGFTAKQGTIVYTLHNRSKTGEVYPQTYQQEGPNFKGFQLSVSLQPGKYLGAAVVPQTLQGPYFPTFLDAVSVEGGKRHYEVRFSYGSRLDPELMKAIFDVLPKTKFRQPPGGDANVRAPQPKRSAAK